MPCTTENASIETESYARTPYVAVSFVGDPVKSPLITVGNESSPNLNPPNTACITGFDYGSSNGAQVTLEIVDTKGGSFDNFVEKLSKKTTEKPVKMLVKWGWILSDCGTGGVGTFDITKEAIELIALDIKVNVSNGISKFTVVGTDTCQKMFGAKSTKVIGDGKKPIPLKQAIKELLQNPPDPVVKNVEFLKKDGGEWEFALGPEEPRYIWQADTQNKIATIMRWMMGFKTKDDKGLFIWYNPSKAGNIEADTIVISEDEKPDCKPIVGGTVIATYVVNGGNKSNVISFSPNINYLRSWAYQFAQGGGVGGPVVAGEKKEDDDPCQNKGYKDAGISEPIIADEATLAVHKKKWLELTRKAYKKHKKANRLFHPIEAELKIIGDVRPEYISKTSNIGKFISLVVLNPFTVFDDGGCPGFLTTDACNKVLTSDRWFIKGVSHSIREGSFITTLSLFLPVPGLDLAE